MDDLKRKLAQRADKEFVYSCAAPHQSRTTAEAILALDIPGVSRSANSAASTRRAK